MSTGTAGAASGATTPRRNDGSGPRDASAQNTRCVSASTRRASGTALPLVGVEQRVPSELPVREGQLPAEVHRVLDPGVHALGRRRASGRGRRLRRGTARPRRNRAASRCWSRHPGGPGERGRSAASRPASSSSACSSARRNRRAGLAERQRFRPGRTGGQQPPGRPLPEREEEQQAASPGDDVGDARARGHRRAPRRPARPPRRTVRRATRCRRRCRTVLAGPSQPTTYRQVASSIPAGVRSVTPRPVGAGVASADQLGAPLHRRRPGRRGPRTARSPRPSVAPGQVRERRVGQGELGQPDRDDAGAEVQAHRGAMSARASSASVTPSGRSTSSVRGCTIRARDGRKRLGSPFDDPDPGAVVVGLQGQGQAGRPGADHEDVRRRLTRRRPAATSRTPSSGAAAVEQVRIARAASSRRRPGSTR